MQFIDNDVGILDNWMSDNVFKDVLLSIMLFVGFFNIIQGLMQKNNFINKFKVTVSSLVLLSIGLPKMIFFHNIDTLIMETVVDISILIHRISQITFTAFKLFIITHTFKFRIHKKKFEQRYLTVTMFIMGAVIILQI